MDTTLETRTVGSIESRLTLKLTRYGSTPMGTFGELEVEGRTLFTVEKPWADNQRSISCIPDGTYQCGPRRYFRGGYDAIEIRDVPDRSYILIHKGNVARHVQGCIAVGSWHGCLGQEWAVLNSREAFSALMAAVGGREWTLEILWR